MKFLILFDNGVSVTINTDDLMIFGQSVSEEYRNLYRADVFSAEELDNIRRVSLEVLELKTVSAYPKTCE